MNSALQGVSSARTGGLELETRSAYGKGVTMRSILETAFVGFLITTAGVCAEDFSLGTWELNLERSQFSPTAPVRKLTIVREAAVDRGADGGVRVTAKGERADGAEINSRNIVRYDGKEHTVAGAPWDRVSITQVDAHTLTSVMKRSDGKYSSTDQMKVSKDGKTMTVTSKGMDAEGKPFTHTMVFEKQWGEQSGTDASISTHQEPVTPTKPNEEKK
jgi:hypothetical protein